MAVTARTRAGVIFTILAMVLVAYLLSSERLAQDRLAQTASQTAIAQTRVDVIDAYLDTFEQATSASLQTAGYLALANLSASVQRNGTYVADINESVFQCIIGNNLTINNARVPCMRHEALLNTSLERLIVIARDELGVTTTYSLHNVTVREERPFEVIFTVEISYNITDVYGHFVVDRANLTARVDVTGIEDPLYAKLVNQSNITETRSFRQTDLLRFELNSTTFPAFYANRSYVTYGGQAPSVLQRYLGQTDRVSACCGIESIVRRSAIAAPSVTYQNYSLVDHQLERHLRGALTYSCSSNDLRAMPAPEGAGTLLIETQRFDNLYNLTGQQLPPGTCAWS